MTFCRQSLLPKLLSGELRLPMKLGHQERTS